MSRILLLIALFTCGLFLAACKPAEKAPAADAASAEVHAPTNNSDDAAWKDYLGKTVGQHMDGVTGQVFPYYLPANSTTPDPADPDHKSQYDRQLENVSGAIQRTVLPGNMLAFGSPDSAKMADMVVAAFTGAKADAVKGSQVLFIGNPGDSARVQAVIEAAGGKYVFIEAK